MLPNIPEAVTDNDTVAESAVLDLARIGRLRTSMPGKPSILAELVALFLEDMPLRLNAIEDAVRRNDAPALALQAHALGGGGANFGARRLDELCGALEEMGARCATGDAAVMLAELRGEISRVRQALLALTG